MTTLCRPNASPSRWCCHLLILFAYFVYPSAAQAQISNSASSLSGTSAGDQAGQPAELSGVVLNAVTNQPVGRALVQAGTHAMLTEHDGKFQFNDTSGSSTLLRVSKPGFYDGPDPNSSGKRATFGSTTEPVKTYLYPEGVITGSITAPNGDPLTGVFVQAFRKSGDESGPRWMMGGQTYTNSDGQFRLPLSAGDYVLETRYTEDRPVRQKALLPMVVPDVVGSGTGSESAIHLESGTEQHFDLRPELRPLHDVHIQSDEASNRSFPQVEAYLPNGLSFVPAIHPSGSPGEFIARLPTGSYILTTATNEGDSSGYARTTVNVGDADVTGVVMHALRSLPMPVEVVVDTSASSAATSDNQPPSVQQLGLYFVRTDHFAPATNQNIYLRASHGNNASFTFTPGRYRLLAQPLSHWFIESATVGRTDLLAQDLDSESGGDSQPLRIVVSNNTAAIKGTVKLDGNPGASCWVYLFTATRGVTPLVYAISGSDGTFSRPSIPPGSYRAVAFETHRSFDFTDSATLERLAPFMKSLTVAPGEVANLDIDAIPTLELKL